MLDGMRITRQIVVFDAPDLAAESAFWAALLDGHVADTDDDWHTVAVDGEPRLGFQLAPNHERPQWPDGAQQQLHLDLYVDDPDAAHEKAVALGAAVLQTADTSKPHGFQVYADPAGHPFCFCWG